MPLVDLSHVTTSGWCRDRVIFAEAFTGTAHVTDTVIDDALGT